MTLKTRLPIGIISSALLFSILYLSNNVSALDIADSEIQYIPYEDRAGTIDVVFCSENKYFRSAEFTLGYSCYKAIDERVQGVGTRLDLENKGDYAIYELPAVSIINKMELIFYKGNERQYDIKVQVAEAGAHVQGDENLVNWVTIFNGKTPNVGGTVDNPAPVTLTFNNVPGQFIRIIGNGAYPDGSNTSITSHTSIIDLQIFGQKTNEVYTYNNRATAQAASQTKTSTDFLAALGN